MTREFPLRLAFTALALSLFAAPHAGADDAFIEGFPDVPLIAGVREVDGEKMLFDTPSGTLGEVHLVGGKSSAELIDAYALALPPLGWNCLEHGGVLACERGKDKLALSPRKTTGRAGYIVIKLEPAE
ncbi:hypothetical protein [Gimibacter soli]|uniref:Uncharacterized protein n=1 Tax=Gimibacter soli TaxID=3024400 RepID=A0AAE9XTX5_9PROT|nr:hypothetical protein [Gimibacter soli]WCL54365.1 hypothetical protein PH603_01160 [Gimibacter soli]